MPPKKLIPKIKLKTVSNKDVLRKIINDDRIKESGLIKIFSYSHQKLHQLYSKNDNHIYNEDDEIYTSLFPRMKKYNEIYYKNKSNYLEKKDENTNFFKQYFNFKKINKEICNDEINTLYGNLIQKYSNKNFEFSKKFLSCEKLFKENGLLMNSKKDIDDYYHKEIKKNGENSQNYMKDIMFINQIYEELEKKRIKYNSIGKNPLLFINNESRRKSCAEELIKQFKRTHQYKKYRREQGMAAAQMVMMKQKDIEKDEKYIQNISKLIEKEEQSHDNIKNVYPFSHNPISDLKDNKNNNNENENNNALFIINRYTKNNFRNTQSIFNNTNNNYKKIKTNKFYSTNNLFSSLYKDDTTNSTFMNINNDIKMASLNRINKNLPDKRYSYKTSLDYSDYNAENAENNNTKNDDYIFIDDTSKIINQAGPKIISKKKSMSITNNSIKNINIKKIIISKKDDNISNEDISINTNFNKTNFYNKNLSNLSKVKNKRKSLINEKKNNRLSFKTNNSIKKISKFNISEDDIDKKELSWDLYKKFIGLKYKIETNNNHKLNNFCNTFLSFPKIVNDKLNKSFKLDEKIKKTHHKFIQSIIEQKIKGFDKV